MAFTHITHNTWHMAYTQYIAQTWRFTPGFLSSTRSMITFTSWREDFTMPPCPLLPLPPAPIALDDDDDDDDDDEGLVNMLVMAVAILPVVIAAVGSSAMTFDFAVCGGSMLMRDAAAAASSSGRSPANGEGDDDVADVAEDEGAAGMTVCTNDATLICTCICCTGSAAAAADADDAAGFRLLMLMLLALLCFM